MTSRTLFLAALCGLAALASTPASAQTSGSTRATAGLSASDEEFLTEMPLEKFPGKEELQDRDNDGIVDADQAGGHHGLIPDPFAPAEEKPKIKYIYNPQSATQLRRSIQDDRIEDGYVQGYMQQTGPAQ